MFSMKAKKELAAIQQVLGWNNGGVYKRIDEGRELLHLLQTKAPKWLNEYPGVKNWIKSTDEFLTCLSKATCLPSASYLEMTGFPRALEHDIETNGVESEQGGIGVSVRSPQNVCQEIPPMLNPDWIAHAYPLQQVTIKLQGTRHSDKAEIIRLLETVLARLKSGDTCGHDHDDDFGYAFEYQADSSGSSFFDEPAGKL